MVLLTLLRCFTHTMAVSKGTTATLLPKHTGPSWTGELIRPMEVTIMFTPDTSRYVVKGHYNNAPPRVALGGKEWQFKILDNFGQEYCLYVDNGLNGKNKVSSVLECPWMGSMMSPIITTLELHTIDGEDTSEWAMSKAVDKRPYYAPLPPETIKKFRDSDTVEYTFTLQRLYRVARRDAALKSEIKEKDKRILALEAKVASLEAQLEYIAIPRIHLVSSPKPVATSEATLLELDEFFSAVTGDFGNLPEFMHESP